MASTAPSNNDVAVEGMDDSKTIERTVGFQLRVWYFPELDQWKLSSTLNHVGKRIVAIGPLRIQMQTVKIRRYARPCKPQIKHR